MAERIILEKSTCDNRICHEHVEPYAHKEPLWYICAEVKWPTQRAYFRETQRETRLRLIYARALPLKIRTAQLSFAQLGDFRTAWSVTDVIFYPHHAPDKSIRAFSEAGGIKREWKREERAIHEVDNPRWRVIPSQHDTACVLIANEKRKKKILAVQFETRAQRTTFT